MDFNKMFPFASEITIARLWMDSTSTMLWNFEEGMGEVDSLGTSSAGSETDTTFALWAAIAKPVAQAEVHQSLPAGNTMLGGSELSTCLMDDSSNNEMEHQRSNLGASFMASEGANFVENVGRSTISKAPQTSNLPLYSGDQVGVTCPICVKPYDQPKVLACFHSFCKSCLQRQLQDRHHVRQSSNPDSIDEGVLINEHCRSESNSGGQPGELLQASNTILVCPLCNVETQLSPQLGIDGLLSDYGLVNAVNEATRRRVSKKSDDRSMLIFGSPSSTSSSSSPVDERITSLMACTGCKSGELANAYCCDCARYLCINCSMAHRYMVCFESHHVEELCVGGALGGGSVNAGGQLGSGGGVAVSSGSSSGIGSGGGGESSSGTSPPSQSASTRSATAAAAAAAAAIAAVAASQGNLDGSAALSDCADMKNDASTHCKCLEHRSQSLLYFCLTCNLAICHDCTLTEHVAPLHAVETIDNVAEKQIGQMETLIHAAHNKQSELHEIFRLIDADQNRLNASFQHAQSNVDESANCLIQLIQEARRTLSKELENAFGYKQLQLTNIEREVQKMVKKMSQTMEFTQRLLKYSSPTEVMVFKPLLDARIQGFLNFNADTSSLTSHSCEIETQPVNIAQARQTIFSLMSSIQSTAVAAAATASAAATAAAVAAAASSTNDGAGWPDSASLQQRELQQNVHLDIDHSAHQMQNQKQQNRVDSTSPSSLMFYQQQHGQQSFHNSTNHVSRPLFAVNGRQPNQQSQQQFQHSSPPMVGSLGGGNVNRLTNSLFDSFATTLSDSNLVGRRGNLNRGVTNDVSDPNADNTNALNAAWFGLGGNSSPFTNASVGESAAAANFLSQNLDHALGFPTSNSVSASAGATSNIQSIFNQYEKWSSGLDPSSLGALSLSDPDTITDLSILANAQLGGADKMAGALGSGSASVPNHSSTVAANAFQLYPPRSQIKRQKMTYHCKFGEFGVMEGQFTEPSGVTVNAQNDIIVADTNNHRIQVFDKEGRFKFQFGECGKRDGQLLYPNRVSVNRVTGDFIVTERSPTHQIQIYNQYGHFVRKFGANILQHPRGVCVDSQGRIIVVECKVMRVIIFDAFGNVIHKFSCSRYLEFPNGVCTNDKNEILISDNRAHCIKVFNYEGHYVRQIGGEGITNYPIGVGINSQGEVIVADNHNNFNLTVFSQDGTMLNALESKVKHAQCFDVALVEDGSVVLASKDYRLYLYRYQNQPSAAL